MHIRTPPSRFGSCLKGDTAPTEFLRKNPLCRFLKVGTAQLWWLLLLAVVVGTTYASGGNAEASESVYAVVDTSYESVQIINITDPYNPAPAGVFTVPGGARGITVTHINGATYAVAASHAADSVQIIDITDPYNPTPAGAATDDVDGFTALGGARDVAVTHINGATYAVVTSSYNDDGVQIIDITDPYNPTPAGVATDGVGGFTTLYTARNVAITHINGATYAVVTSYTDEGVQIIDITDPYNPTPAGAATNRVAGFTELSGADGIAVTHINGATYAVVTSSDADPGVQIIDITDPYNPTPAGVATAGMDGFIALGDPRDVAVTHIRGATYAVVISWVDDGVQIIDITDPYNPTPAGVAYDGIDGFTTLGWVYDIAITHIRGATYAVVTSWEEDGVQIIDITDPYNPTPAGVATHGIDGFTALDDAENVAIYVVGDGGPGKPSTLEPTTDEPPTIEPIPDRTAAVGDIISVDIVAADPDGGALTYETDTGTMDGNKLVWIPDVSGMRQITVTVSDGYNTVNATFDVAVAPPDGARTYAVVASLNDDGVQIIDITDPYNPTPAGAATDDVDGFTALYGARGIAVTHINEATYAVVVSWVDGVQIIDITDPHNPTPAGAATDDVDGFTELFGANDVAVTHINEATYAVVAAWKDNGVQIIDITDPYNPTPAGAATDDVDGFTELSGAYNIAVTHINEATYAVVASDADSGVQIIDITDPYNPTPAGAATDDVDGFTELFAASDVAITHINGATYAVVASDADSGVQIIDITDPYNPAPAGAATDGIDGFFVLNGARGIAVTNINGATYAVMTSRVYDGVQIIDITDPYNPAPAGVAYNDADGFALGDVNGIAVTHINGATYAVATSWGDDSVQIIDITDPYNPAPAGVATDDVDGFTTLYTPNGIAIYVVGDGGPGKPPTIEPIPDRTAAVGDIISVDIVAADPDGGALTYGTDTGTMDGNQLVWIPDVSGMRQITVTVSDGYNTVNATFAVAVAPPDGARTYAVVASQHDSGVQIIDITDPYNPTPAGAATDGVDGFTELSAARDVAITHINGATYAVVTSQYDSGVQIIDITDPYNPTPAGAATDGVDGFTALDEPYDVAITHINGATYAVVVSNGGVLIIDITDPYNPTPAGAAYGGIDGFTTLSWEPDVAITHINGATYAVVASQYDSGVQII